MIPAVDMWRAANLLIQQHRSDVELEAARLQDLMLDRADEEGQVVWRRIRPATEALQARPSGKPN